MLISLKSDLIMSSILEIDDYTISLHVKRGTDVVVVDTNSIIYNSNRSDYIFPICINNGIAEVEWPGKENL